MATAKRHDVAKTINEWASAVREDEDIRDEVKRHGRLTQLAVSDCLFDKSGSDITHTEYLHLRTIWYRYNGTHIESFTRLFRDDKETGYKGFISHTADEWASRLMSQKLAPLDQYLHEFQRRQGDPEYLHPSPASGYFAMVRYWQVMAITHTKGDNEGRSKIFKPRIGSGPLVGTSSARPVTPPQQQEPQGADLPSQPSTSGIPPISATPAARSYPAARGTAENRPSADEAYVNTALLLLLQAVTQLFHKNFEPLHWVPPRMALHLKVPTANQETRKYDESVLLEARVDGYLCNGALEGGLSRPLAICEAKSAVRSSIQVPTERQEAAEMAAWICNSQSHVGLLQASASGRKRRLMISQTRDEIWIIIGEYGQAYEEYIRNAPLKAGMTTTRPPPLKHTRPDLLASNFEETLGSPAFLDQIEKMGVEGDIKGWKDPAVQAALSERAKARATQQASVGDNPKKPVQTPDLPKIDGFLVMHRFGPWKTFDKENMQVFVRRLLGLMIELHINESSHSHSASSGSSK
ncbi:hypothetical protein MYCTH_2068188 [Thermothelomyces thermophilus ATCC 42464]|uniref:Uncharacterized protein n=1 Tax=Thermothelomyces thermophilus (strain ATCC 42464 / BCRC 31852 / DSM 1799) TaxID=573729 RepID=G2QJW4_THET4|nr:uncharacterized protein MYCTH_2068188 [Thermothelomyces thermophilus ATCC 42464]AEO59870.1 hypothetical protein MYCTH_2068188 [Thermothelomyces thermophilus ATCC 42464]